MKKRILSIVLVLALCLAYLPVQVHAVDYEVADSDELQAALTGLANGDTIILTQDIEYGFEIGAGVAGQNYTLDLNGHILSLPAVSFVSAGSWTITDSSGMNSGILEVGIDFQLTNAASTLTISNGAGLEVNGVFTLAGPSITMSGPNSMMWNGVVNLPDDVTLNFLDQYFSIEISNVAEVETPGTLGLLAAVLQNYVKDRYLLTGVTTMTVTDRTTNTDLTPPVALTLKDWVPPTIDISFLNSTYNGQQQELIVVGNYDASTVEGIRYGDTGNVTETTSGTQTNAGDYNDLAYLVLGTDDYGDIYATGAAHINPADNPIVFASSKAMQVGTTVPDISTPTLGTDYTVTGLYGTDAITNIALEYQDSGTHTPVGDADILAAPAGTTYDIVASAGTISTNYAGITYQPGTLTITENTPVTLLAEPQAIDGLVYNGQDQALVTGGTAEGGTMVYSIDAGVTWDAVIPTGKDAHYYEVVYRIEPDAGYSAVDAYNGEIGLHIEKAPAVTIGPVETTMYLNDPLPTLYTIREGTLYGNDIDPLTIEPLWEDTSPETDPVVGQTYAYTLFLSIPAGADDNYVAINNASGNGSVKIIARPSGNNNTKQESYDHSQFETGPGSGKSDDFLLWADRGNFAKDIGTLYMVLSNNGISEAEEVPLPYPGVGTEHFLASNSTWILPETDPEGNLYPVADARECLVYEPWFLANGDGKVDESTFASPDFYTVGVGTGDMKIDYPNLQTGDVVSNTSFNGVFVTKVQKSNNPTFDADLAKLKDDTIASYRSFELDHPEVFWLNGSVKLKVLTVTIGSEQTSFIFLTLVDDKGFSMLIPEYAAPGAIEAGIQQRDAAVNAIIAQIPEGATAREKIANLNKWFTLNNEYNRSADLSTIGFTPHRALKSLLGNFGINGPVCDGYSRGFKVVCDRIGIPVVLETGVASIGTHSELHMWMSVKVDGVWYGMDCTWNDPIVKGKDGKVSGYENEKYMLVGDDTVVDGAKFGISHPANKTPDGVTGVLFASLVLSPNEISGYVPIDYDDVRTSDWFYDYVQDVSRLSLMNGTSPNTFSPQGTATRGQIVQILYNIAGQPEVDEVKVDGWFGVPATWAMNKGIVAGYPDGDFHGNDPVTREQLATIIWAFEGAPEQSGTLSFADADKVSSYAVQALLWAKKEGIMGGKPGNLIDPQGTATRAEIATIFSNYMK